MGKVRHFFKSEIVLIISLLLAVGSAFFVVPSFDYFGYIDFRTLSLLFCLMAVMSGLGSLGVFGIAADRLLSKVSDTRRLVLITTMLCFFSSMLITNDVALITFVPFTIIMLKRSGNEKLMIPAVVFETLAANLGSMLLPVGNPQNLYIFSFYNLTFREFLSAVIPYCMLSLILLIIMCLFIKKDKRNIEADCVCSTPNILLLTVYIALFVLALLTVFRVIPYYITIVITLVAVVIFDRKTLLKIDYSLLLTFVFLFIFIGNLGSIEYIKDFLSGIVSGNEIITAVLASQIISNVPAAILLSGFTENAAALLVGTNIGGLGTLIASMASLISFRLIAHENISTAKYILFFTILNTIMLILNLLLCLIIL